MTTETIARAEQIRHVTEFIARHDIAEQVISCCFNGQPSILLAGIEHVEALANKCGVLPAMSKGLCEPDVTFCNVEVDGIRITSNETRW